jgi:hypothetical protein
MNAQIGNPNPDFKGRALGALSAASVIVPVQARVGTKHVGSR